MPLRTILVVSLCSLTRLYKLMQTLFNTAGKPILVDNDQIAELEALGYTRELKPAKVKPGPKPKAKPVAASDD